MMRDRFHAVFLAAIMIFSVVAMGAGFAGGAVGKTDGLLTVDDEFSSPEQRGSASSDAIEADDAASVEAPALFSPTTLGAVVGAFLLALLIVAVIRRMDR